MPDVAVDLLHRMIGELDGYVGRRASELAAPVIAQARAEAAEKVRVAQDEAVRQGDLAGELRRCVEVRERMVSGAAVVVERIMSQHWDMAACPCWVCTAGRAAGLHPRERYLPHRDPGFAMVRVEESADAT